MFSNTLRPPKKTVSDWVKNKYVQLFGGKSLSVLSCAFHGESLNFVAMLSLWCKLKFLIIWCLRLPCAQNSHLQQNLFCHPDFPKKPQLAWNGTFEPKHHILCLLIRSLLRLICWSTPDRYAHQILHCEIKLAWGAEISKTSLFLRDPLETVKIKWTLWTKTADWLMCLFRHGFFRGFFFWHAYQIPC